MLCMIQDTLGAQGAGIAKLNAERRRLCAGLSAACNSAHANEYSFVVCPAAVLRPQVDLSVVMASCRFDTPAVDVAGSLLEEVRPDVIRSVILRAGHGDILQSLAPATTTQAVGLFLVSKMSFRTWVLFRRAVNAILGYAWLPSKSSLHRWYAPCAGVRTGRLIALFCARTQ